MERNTLVCDRCSKEADQRYPAETADWIVVRSEYRKSGGAMHLQKDLCRQCSLDLSDFLKTPPPTAR